MQLPIDAKFVFDRRSGLSLQDQLMSRIRELVLKGQLAPRSKLPSTRALSEQLDVARNTVALAYERLVAEGYLEAQARSGIFVSSKLPEFALEVPQVPDAEEALVTKPSVAPVLPVRYLSAILYQRPRERVPIDFRVGRPSFLSFPKKRWTRLLVEKMAGSNRRMTEYNNPAGLEELRVAIAEHLRRARGIASHPDQVIIVSGCQEGLNIVAKILSPPGSTVYVENPCYKGARYVFESHGARVVPVAVDEDGLCTEQLGREPSIVYVTPSHQFPLGVTMSLPRRLKLLQWASETGSVIVEDDYDSDFRYDGSPLTALAGLNDVRSVIYVGTFSKSLGAGLRLGYVVVPERLIGAIREVKALLNHGHSWLDQAVLAEFITSGAFALHLRRIRKLYMRRRDILIDELREHFGRSPILGVEGGMHVAWLAPEWVASVRALQNECLRQGIGVYTVDDGPAIDFDDSPLRNRAVFFGYPCVVEDDIPSGIRGLLAAALKVNGNSVTQ